MTDKEKIEVLKEILDCDGTAFVFLCDKKGFIELHVVGDEIRTQEPEHDVQSQMYNLCCNIHRDIINWRSKKAEE